MKRGLPMLDDLKLIHERDVQDALGVNAKQAEQLHGAYDVAMEQREYRHVVLAGMGGSALAAQIALVWPGLPLPFEIVRGYELPQYVDSQTLFIASSYSGNTEETLTALDEAAARSATITVIAAGGKLERIAAEKGYPFWKLPAISQPRYAALAGLKALLSLLVAAGVLAANKLEELEAQANWLDQQVQAWLPERATSQNYAKQLAHEVLGKSVVVYGGPKTYPAAYKWKISFNENAKQVAWVNQYPEFNHNEFLGWTEQPVDKPYVVFDLRSSLEHPRVQKRFEVTARLLSGRRPAPQVIVPDGDTILRQLLWLIALGDFVSIYAAILANVNPTPVDLIEKFKKSLDN